MLLKRALWISSFVGCVFLTSLFLAQAQSENITCDEDTSLVAYVSDDGDDSNIWFVTGDGIVKSRLTHEDGRNIYPSWSPDGSTVVYQSDRDGNWEIYIHNLVTGPLTNLTQNAADDTNPAWSPDGSRIAFVSNRDGT